MKNLMVMACLVALAGCAEGPCDAGASRCTGNVVEVCDAKREWRALADCGELSRLARRPLVCAFVAADDAGVIEGDTCIPEPAASP
jgi:hypothetical protein